MALLTVGIVSVSATIYWIWLWRETNPITFADGWYIYRFAYTRKPVSPPYCWRPFVPILLRYFGRWPSHLATAATPLVIYGYLEGGWTAAAVAIAFVGNAHIFLYNVKHPEMSEAFGQLLLVSTLWSLKTGHWSAIPLAILAMLTREAIGGVVIIVALLTGAYDVSIGATIAGAAAYVLRNEDRNNRHPLIEETSYGTLKRWATSKGPHSFDWPQFIGSTRGAPFFLPWFWSGVEDFGRLALSGYVVLWLFSLPASGVTRHLAYGFVLFAPYVVAAGSGWAWTYCLVSWFWPIDFSNIQERNDGKSSFLVARGTV